MVYWLALWLLFLRETLQCSHGWFGSRCQFKCHCLKDFCDTSTGTCEASAICLPPWFGPACQYKDAASSRSDAPAYLTDWNDYTCNANYVASILTVKLTIVFSWATLIFRQRPNPATIRVYKSNENYCMAFASAVNSAALNVQCQTAELVSSITIKGDSVKYLCSLYISEGRNVALKQQVTVTGTDGVEKNAPEIVDDALDMCTQVDHSENCVALKLDSLKIVYQLEFHVKQCCQGQLELIMNWSNDVGNKFRSFSETVTMDDPPVYRIIADFEIPMNSISIEFVGTGKENMTLCELAVYGDRICPEDTYGQECKHSCLHCRMARCAVSTGVCLFGLGLSRIGDTKPDKTPINQRIMSTPRLHPTSPVQQIITPGTRTTSSILLTTSFWPSPSEFQTTSSSRFFVGRMTSATNDKRSPCASRCLFGVCTPEGRCAYSCASGYQGYFCDKVCPSGLYGINCALKCSETCIKESSCDRITGNCVACEDGYFGSHCNLPCGPGLYGRNCEELCNVTCVDKLCDRKDGRCLQCTAVDTYDPQCISSHDVISGNTSILTPTVFVVVFSAVLICLWL